MKQIATNCKFCKAPITLEIDDSYDPVSDPNKLIPLAACNPCADIRVRRRILETKIGKACRALQLLSPGDKEDREELSKILEKLTQGYAKMICKWHGYEGMVWEECCVAEIVSKPDHWGEALGRMWQAFHHWRKQQEET